MARKTDALAPEVTLTHREWSIIGCSLVIHGKMPKALQGTTMEAMEEDPSMAIRFLKAATRAMVKTSATWQMWNVNIHAIANKLKAIPQNQACETAETMLTYIKMTGGSLVEACVTGKPVAIEVPMTKKELDALFKKLEGNGEVIVGE